MHRLNVVLKLFDFLILLVLNALLLSFYFLPALLQSLKLLFVLIFALLKLGLMLAQLFICGLVLACHVGDDGICSRFLSLLRLL